MAEDKSVCVEPESKAEKQVAPRSVFALQAEEEPYPNQGEGSASVGAKTQAQRR
jgi:hypothetical protein